MEDTPDSLDFLTILLQTAGHRVTGAASGREAIRMCREKRFDVVLLDVVLPDVDGMRVAEAVRETRTPLIAMSAHLNRWNEDEFSRAGFRHRLRKPFRSADLLDVLKH